MATALLAVASGTANVQASPLASRQPATTNLVGAEVLGTPYAPSGPQETARYISPAPATAGNDRAEGGRCIAHNGRSAPLRCVFGDLKSHTTVYLLGDSHAMQWEPAIKAAARSRGWKLVTYTKWGCPFNAQEVMWVRQPYASCHHWNQRVMNAVIAAHPTLVLTSAKKYKVPGPNGDERSYAQSKPYLIAGYKRWWNRLHNSGIPITVIADTPVPNIDIDQCVAAHRHHLRRCAEDRTRYTWQGGQALARAAGQTAFVHRVNFNDLVCPWQRCPAVLQNILIWRQTGHITARYAFTAKRQVGHRVAAVLAKDNTSAAEAASVATYASPRIGLPPNHGH